LVYLVPPISLIQPNKQDKPNKLNKQEKPAGFHALRPIAQLV